MTDGFEERMELMEIRARLVKVHMASQQQVFLAWQNAETATDWYRVAQGISGLQRFLTRHRKNFPNYVRHMSQWTTLYSVAKQREWMEAPI